MKYIFNEIDSLMRTYINYLLIYLENDRTIIA